MAHLSEIVRSAVSGTEASVIALLTVVVVVFLTLTAIHRAYIHPLRRVPGPRLARFTELWRTNRYFQGDWFHDILDLHEKYGPVVRIAPNEVSVVSPYLIKTVYSHTGGTVKTRWYDTWAALGGGTKAASEAPSFFGATDPNQHSFLRRRVSATYSMSAIVALEPKIQSVLDMLWTRLDESAKLGQPVDLSIWASYFTYDVVGTLCLSEPMGLIYKGKDERDFFSCIHGAFYWIANLGNLPWQSYWIANPVTGFLAPRLNLRIADYARAFQRFSIDKILSRMQNRGEGTTNDMLDHFLQMKTVQGEPAPLLEILAEVGNLLAAGADTTSVAIKAVLGPVLKDPIRYKRLQMEIDAAREAAGGKSLTYNAVKDLPFLTACVKEGSRIHPSIIYQLPRVTPAEGLNIEGYYTNASTTVSISPLAQNRCRAIFGEDANEWRPERWIEGEGNTLEKIRQMDKQLATFGYGSRTCIGRNLAMFKVFKFVAQLMSRYEVELVDRDAAWKIRSRWFAEIDNCWIRLKAGSHPSAA
ncbi:cytochrome P450 [Aspergillus pseudoustus]|uniref:Cytochrome P450 n=1 Tax=Aspergillus pseudoustus TaxID=1810923 RepID=A0ABR4K9G5_9EURO